MVTVRAVYRDGKFQPLDDVNLQDGQEVQLQIVPDTDVIRDLIGDMLVRFDSSDTMVDEDAIMRELDSALAGKRPLSEIIIEDRRDGR